VSLFIRRRHAPGTPPGTLIPSASPHPPVVTLVEYSDVECKERVARSPTECLAAPEECRAFLDSPSTTWIHVQGGMEPELLRNLARVFGLHALALEDVQSGNERPKVEDYEKDQLFIVMRLPVERAGRMGTEQVSMFVGRKYLVTFLDGERDPFERVRERLRGNVGRLRRCNSDYLMYTLADLVVDQGFPVLERFGEELEDIEEALADSRDQEVLVRLHELRRELLLLRRTFWPQREVLKKLVRDDYACIAEETKVFLRDCYDHTVEILDLLETYREMATGMLDVYLSTMSNRLNDIMRVLTIISTIFIPLTFIVGVYGMNFEANQTSPWAMPELRWAYGYPVVWLVMLVIAIGMIIFFWRKRWL
jgi:magnesium transporter